MLIPQRYEFSSKSQPCCTTLPNGAGCCWYHKGTNFQANHNKSIWLLPTYMLLLIPQRYEFSSKSQQKIINPLIENVVADTTKVRIFKQITTANGILVHNCSCCWYHKGTNFQANHNNKGTIDIMYDVVADTTKVRIFKQITTYCILLASNPELLLIPQRYEFSSKSQRNSSNRNRIKGCCWYHKGTNFQANHNARAYI